MHSHKYKVWSACISLMTLSIMLESLASVAGDTSCKELIYATAANAWVRTCPEGLARNGRLQSFKKTRPN